MKKNSKKAIHYYQIMEEAEKYEGTAADFFLMTWCFLLKEENKPTLHSVAETLNVYPHPVNVLNAVKFELLKHMGGMYESHNGELFIAKI